MKIKEASKILTLNAAFAALYIFFSCAFINDSFVPLDKTKTIEPGKDGVIFRLPRQEPYILKFSAYMSADMPLSVLFNGNALKELSSRIKKEVLTSWSIERKDIKTSKYFIPQEYVNVPENKVEARNDGGGTVENCSATIKNFISKPVKGMYLLSDQAYCLKAKRDFTQRFAKSFVFGLILFLAMTAYSYFLSGRMGASTKTLFFLDSLVLLPFIVFFTAVWAVSFLSPYAIILLPSFFFLPFISLYLKTLYPCWLIAKKLKLYKIFLLGFFYMISGCALSIMLGFDFLGRFFANTAYVFLFIAVIICIWGQIRNQHQLFSPG